MKEKIRFTAEDIILACMKEFRLSKNICKLRYAYAVEENDGQNGFIDFACRISESVTNYMVTSKIFEKSRNDFDQALAGEIRLIISILKNYSIEAENIENKMKFYNFSNDEKKFEKMIFDLLKSSNSITENCIEILELTAGQLEKFKNHDNSIFAKLQKEILKTMLEKIGF